MNEVDIINCKIRRRLSEVSELRKRKKSILMAKKAKNSVHHVIRKSIGKQWVYEALCNSKIIPVGQDKSYRKYTSSDFWKEFKNATFYEGRINCPVCIANMRPHAGECPLCDVEFDTAKHTYCGNCGKKTRNRKKLRMVVR